MAQPQMLQVKLSRFDAQPWGFRLQGGVDFAQPLLVQKVNAGSLSEQAGLQPGDAVIKINDVDVFSMRHKDAQDIVVRSGNNFVITVQRGGSTWRPHVTPTGNVPQANSPYLQTVTKTSLAHHQQDSQHIGCGYNNSARPFGTDGGDGVKSIVNKQYNTPVGIYSDESIAETLSAQAEVLAGGVLGVNFKKNEKEYQADRSEVLKFLREEETGQSTPAFGQNNNNNGHYEHDAPQQQQQHHHQHQHQHQHQQHQHQQQQQVYQSNGATRHVSAPVNTPKPPSTGGLPTGQNICTECERLITAAQSGELLWTQSHAIGGNERRTPLPHSKFEQDERIGTNLQQNTLAPAATHRPSLPVAKQQTTEQQQQVHEQELVDPRIIVMPICPALQGPDYKAEMQTALAAAGAGGGAGPRTLSASGHPPCQLCGVGIVGVFVRIKDKNLHVECFKCATCGTSLKNQGYYNFNNKLYCDIHAKQAAQSHPPPGTEGYVPVPIKPNTKLSANTISSALSSHGYGNNGYANGNSTPTPAPSELSSELPLPPPPSPTQLQLLQYETEEAPPTQQTTQQQQQQHTRTNSSLSSISSGSSSGVGSGSAALSPNSLVASSASNLSLDLESTRSPAHSRQASGSCNSLDAMPTTPPLPPPPAPAAQNENDMNTQNKNHNAYNQLLKQYSNKLQQQQQSNTNRHNNTAKPFAAAAQQPHVAALTATLANQLKFNSHQAANAAAAAATNEVDNTPLNMADEQSAAAIYGDAAAAAACAMPCMQTSSMSAGQDQPFEYVTLTGNVIRSVQPPGKGANASYKVNQGYVRPFGAQSAPKSPVPMASYPPQQQQQQSPRAAAGANAYATLPRSNVGQQGRNVQRYNSFNNKQQQHHQQQQQQQYQQQQKQQYRNSYPAYGANNYSTQSYNNNNNNSYNRAPLATPINTHANTTCNAPLATPKATDTESNDADATAMLAESIGKINMGEQTSAFMQEAGKIISNMLEARLAGSATPSHAGSSLSLRSNSSSNLTKSPMIVRKRLDLDDFKHIDPTQPAALQTVVAVPAAAAGEVSKPQLAQPQVARVEQTLQAELPAQHPMSKILDICDSGKQPQQAPEPVAFRNNLRRNTGATHAADRRSYIEPKPASVAPSNSNGQSIGQGGATAPTFSVSVKALGGQQGPMSEENEKAVSQLLQDGKRPICCQCSKEITSGPFITALGRIWCPDHFICVNGNCRRPLQDIGFVEEKGDLYCEYCFEKFLAPSCSKCAGKIKGDCLNAIGKHFHPECFTCGQCGKVFGNTPFFLEDGNAYCEADWNELFTTKCFACGFPVEAGDRWVEALNHNYHSQCFNCTYCKQNLEGQSFYNKGGRPFCKNHAR